MRPLIKTFTGRMFPLDKPTPQDIDILDIAHGLANMCRFSGQLLWPYYVAQHCVLVSKMVPRGLELQGLLHDAAEAYVGDMTSPLKHLLIQHNEHTYRLIENGIMDAIAIKFGIQARKQPEVHHVDLCMFATEATHLMKNGMADYKVSDDIVAYKMEIVPWSHDYAEAMFLKRYQQLVDARSEA